ncbi:MAG: AAA family ATPase, partial [Pirellula sp.]
MIDVAGTMESIASLRMIVMESDKLPDDNGQQISLGNEPITLSAKVWLDRFHERSERLTATLSLAADIVSELCSRHAAGDFFANISGESILVRTADSKAFIASGLGAASKSGTPTVEQAVFLAPEQSGTLQHSVGPSTDLYSVGVFLYRLLSDKNPIQATNLSELLLKQMTISVPSLRWCGIAIPRCVDEYVLRLLNRDPRDRYQSATAALDDLYLILRWMDNPGLSSVILGLTERRDRLSVASFVERDTWIRYFVQSITDRPAKPNRTILLGNAGIGKTRLLDEFAKEAKAHGAMVVRATGTNMDESRPLEIFEAISRDLEDLCLADDSFSNSLSSGLAEHQESLQALLPSVFKSHHRTKNTGPERFAGRRFVSAIERLLDLLNDQPMTVVMLVDNLDRVDKLSREVLSTWLRNRAGKSGSLFFVATGAASNAARLQSEFEIKPELLEPMSPQSIASILQSMIGEFPKDVVQLAAGACAGNPFLAISMLQGTIESKSVQYQDGVWRLRSKESLVLKGFRQANVALSTRIDGLAPEVIQFLKVCSILGNSFRINEAQALSNLSWNSVHESLQAAIVCQLLWSNVEYQQAGFVHEDVRKYFLERINANDRGALHLQSANLILKDGSDRSYELAFHFDAAGYGDETIDFALQAAKHAHRQYANDLAIRYYQLAQKWIPAHDRLLRKQTAESVGEVFLNMGKYDEAEEAFKESLFYAETTIDRTQLVGRLGDVEFKRGRMGRAASQYVKALALSGVYAPRSFPVMLVGLVWQVVKQTKHTFLGLTATRPIATPIHVLQWTLFSRLAHTYWFSRGALWTLFAHLKGMNDAERFQDTPELAKSYSEHAPVCSLLRCFKRAERYSERSLIIRQKQNDTWGKGQTLSYASVVHLAATNFEPCIKTATEAIALLNRTGDAWETNMAGYQRACALYRAGRYREAAADAKRIHLSGVTIGDDQVAGISLDVWMR